jgi:undecaprenyl pyrophosphate synthase
MKKIFTAVMALGLIVSSCGDASGDASGDSSSSQDKGPVTVCDCIDLNLDMMKDMLNGMSEEEAATKYAKDMESCKALGKGKSPEELDAMNKQAEDCASMGEMQKIQQELMTKMMSEQMMEQGVDAVEDAVEAPEAE